MIGAGVAALLLMTLALTRLEPRAPGVDRATLLIAEVERGTLVRQVRAPGTLIPERNLYIVGIRFIGNCEYLFIGRNFTLKCK